MSEASSNLEHASPSTSGAGVEHPATKHPLSFLQRASVFRSLGPGLVTGAADDDPSGIATYSQAGAQFGLNMLWTVILTYPLMAAIQSISARIGRVTGKGLSANMLGVFPRPVVLCLVGLLFFANTVNIGADLAAMGAAAQLIIGWNEHVLTLGFALTSLALQILMPYHRYVRFLKWLTLVLFAYVGVIFAVKIDWGETLARSVWPHLALTPGAMMVIVAIFGTTISPYMFFWQASAEVEGVDADPNAGPLADRPEQAKGELNRIRLDTYIGMLFSNLIAFFIILTTAVTLFPEGKTDIQTSADAAKALLPVAGPFAFMLFALGIIGTGLLAVPVLAGSTAYAISDAMGWKGSLEQSWNQAKAFYATIALSVLCGIGINFAPIDPFVALFWSAILNGVMAVPIMAAMMIVATRKLAMGEFVATRSQVIFGWLATGLMALTVVAMVALNLAP